MSTDINLELLSRYENRIVWNLNQLCNYRCTYCFFSPEVLGKEHDGVGQYSIEHICKSFDDTGREWLVLISGGEPFLYKELIPLVKLLTRNHHIQLTSNFSRPSVYQFADEIDPSRVMIMGASYHPVERENRNAVQDFVDKYVYFRERGFLIAATYVAYPSLLSRIRDDFERLRTAGVDNIITLTFRGFYGGKQYPEAYTDEELELIVELSAERELEAEISGGLHYRGRLCNAGFTYFQMNPDGNLHRCCSILTDHGNLFEGTARFEDRPTQCTVEICENACLGVLAVREAGNLVNSIQTDGMMPESAVERRISGPARLTGRAHR